MGVTERKAVSLQFPAISKTYSFLWAEDIFRSQKHLLEFKCWSPGDFLCPDFYCFAGLVWFWFKEVIFQNKAEYHRKIFILGSATKPMKSTVE